MSQYDMQIIYIPGEDNTVADAMSHVPEGAFPGKSSKPSHKPTTAINVVLSLTTYPSILQTNSVRNLSHCQPGLMASLHHTDCGTLVIIY